MTKNETRKYDMLTRVRGFAAIYGQLFPGTSTAHEAFASLAEAIDRLEAIDVAERAASDGARATRRDAARAVFDTLLKRAGATARVLRKTHSQLQARIPLPLPKDNLQALTLARQFAAGAASCGADFAARAIPLSTFEAGITLFEAALAHHGTSREQRVTVRAERQAVFAQAMHAVETLDVIVANGVTDPVALALWAHDRLVTPPRRRRVQAEDAGATAEAGAASPEPTAPARVLTLTQPSVRADSAAAM